jgi:hypothetical protein
VNNLRAALVLLFAPFTPCALGLLSSGCHGASVRSQEDANSRIITMQLFALRQGQERPEPLPQNGHLHSGERFAVLGLFKKPLYVTLLRKAPGDQYERLFPDRDSGAVPHASLRMPDDSGFYTLDQRTGTEELRLVASVAALTEPQAIDAARRYDQAAPRSEPPSAPAGSAPSAGSPPPASAPAQDGTTVKAQLAQNNVAVAAFSFVHD